MKHLMRYEGFSSQERLDEILDKISKYGIGSISNYEKDFLDSHKSETQEEIHKKLQYKENEIIFEDDYNRFRFELNDIEDHGGELHISGTLYVPDISFENAQSIEGRIEGEIIVYPNNETSPNFYKNIKDRNREIVFDVFDFIEGLEYEFDSFIDYIVDEVKNTHI